MLSLIGFFQQLESLLLATDAKDKYNNSDAMASNGC